MEQKDKGDIPDGKDSKKIRKRWSLIPNKLGRSKSFKKESSKTSRIEYDFALRRGMSEHGRSKNKQKPILSISSPTVELPTIDITDENSIYSSVNTKPDVQLAALQLFNDTMSEKIGVDLWLKTLQLEQYIKDFQSYTTVDSLLHLTEQDLLDLGVKSPVHRARIASNLVLIRQKCARYNTAGHIGTLPRKRSQASQNNKSHRHSIQGESSKFYRPTPKKMELWQKKPSQEQLKKNLEMELNLPQDDIRSHAWFHGGISRQQAVKSLKQDGEFLVRDSISKPGSYVVSVMWHKEVLHYVINKTIQQQYTPYAKIQYQMEINFFDSVPALILFYHGKKPISRTSNAIIRMPVNRTLPLSFTDANYDKIDVKQIGTPVYGSVMPKVITPRISALPQANSFQKQSLKDESETYYDSSNARTSEKNPENQSRLSHPEDLYSYPVKKKAISHTDRNYIGDKNYEYKADRKFEVESSYLNDEPVRDDSGSIKILEKRLVLNDEQSDLVYEALSRNRFLSDNGESDEKYSTATEHCGSQMDHSKLLQQFNCLTTDTENAHLIVQHPRLPNKQMCSRLCPLDFKCKMLPEDHRILDPNVLGRVQDILIDSNPHLMAQHILSLDIELLQMISIPDGCVSGLELLTLPQGSCLRNDLQERFNCLRIWCAVTIVYCTEIEKRVMLLNAWIQLADAIAFKLGDLFAFSAIMEGLASKQVRDLRLTWELLRKSFTNSALLHDTQLRSHFKKHQQGKMVINTSQTSIPAIMPVVQLLEMDWSLLTTRDWCQPINKEVIDNLPKDELWVDSMDSFGLEVFMRHLTLVRSIIRETTTYQLNANSRLQNFTPVPDILDSFRTELHMIILWGQRGLQSNCKDRFMKYEQMLELLAKKAEPSS